MVEYSKKLLEIVEFQETSSKHQNGIYLPCILSFMGTNYGEEVILLQEIAACVIA